MEENRSIQISSLTQGIPIPSKAETRSRGEDPGNGSHRGISFLQSQRPTNVRINGFARAERTASVKSIELISVSPTSVASRLWMRSAT
jgi:hypothetical protein